MLMEIRLLALVGLVVASVGSIALVHTAFALGRAIGRLRARFHAGAPAVS